MASVHETADAVGRFASHRIWALQGGLVGGNAGANASARAALARLRKLDAPGGGAWIVAGSDVFEGMPEEVQGRRAMDAIKVAMRLYAIHQQSKAEPMACAREADDADGPRRTFGWSCKGISYGDEGRAQGVERRMACIERAARDGLSGVETHMRALIQMMRAEGVQVDYYLLARDLLLVQFEYMRGCVFQRWARDYYARPPREQALEVHDMAASGDTL